MEKLLELANQFELEREKWIESFKDNELPLWKWYVDTFWDLCYESNKYFNWEDCYWDTAMAVFISKHYWFIEWLVKSDRIDWDKFWDMETETNHYFDSGYTLLYSSPIKDYVNVLLMELAINNEPIRFLAEVIK